MLWMEDTGDAFLEAEEKQCMTQDEGKQVV